MILSVGQSLRNNKMMAILVMFVVLGGLGWLIQKWSVQPGSPELRIGQRIMYQIMGSETLHKTSFFDRYPQAQPSDFVEFAGSPAGEVLWPPMREKQSAAEGLRNRGKIAIRILRPKSLTFSAYRPRPGEHPQIVYIPRDEENIMVIEGYDPGDDRPEFVYEWKFPTKAGAIDLNQ